MSEKILTIDKNVPVDMVRGTYARTLRSMDYGDSVFIADPIKKNSFIAAAIREGVKVASKKQVGGYRIWRIDYRSPETKD